MSVRLESGTRTGWLYTCHAVTEESEDAPEDVEGQGVNKSALKLLFQDHAGDTFFVHLHFSPYLLVQAAEGHEREVELGLMSMFGPQLIQQIVTEEKEDLSMINHLSGRKRLYLKVLFNNQQDQATVRGRIQQIVQRNASMNAENPLMSQFNGTLGDAMAKAFENDPLHNPTSSGRWADWVQDMREYDVKYHMRVAIDMNVHCGLWYDVTVEEGEASVARCDESKYPPAMPRVVAFDIETTKAPLKFPQPEVDQIYMISYMLDRRGYLIINREIVTEDIAPFEYTPKPEYEGFFETFNESDEAATLRRFFDELKKYQPNVYVTYNGDYFDFPFIHARALINGMNMRKEIGFSQSHDGAFLNSEVPHLDCFYWVKRDSYLPQGSQGLKAVTKYKLGYDPIEVDPEDMLPLAQTNPQRMASYSVSDAVSTWYLYMKYVHPFIFSLATIIPMTPDDVLRKGSGGLCESLLMVQARTNNVVFPNKTEAVREKFYDGHLIDTETYIGGRVEALRSGVFRSDIPLQFNMNPDMFQTLIEDVDSTLAFVVTEENGLTVDEVTNLEEVSAAIKEKLAQLRDQPKIKANPFIYHLDVGAMYPNIILTNRLQPYSIVRPDVCAGCCFNTPNNEHHCKRTMSWKWRGEMFTAGRYEFQRIKAQLENERFAASVIEQVNLEAVQKKAYGNRAGNVLAGTAYERKDDWKKKKDRQKGGSGGYRQENRQQQREADDALIQKHGGGGSGDDDDDDDSDEDGGGPKAFHKLNETTQFNMLKKRLGEYSRKAYGKVRESREVMRSNVVCQRENAFYVDTVRLFRDRRYEYKEAERVWKRKLAAATDPDDIKTCQGRVVQMESLQLAHKCILNSFYGYVMRKGSRWYSMEMAGIVTYLGATLIQMARALVQQIGVTLELDTDGIWCCLPQSFPDNFTLTTTSGKKPKINLSYPCAVLNKMVHDRYTNDQYQTLVSPGVYSRRSECSIYFEVDGPYLAMLLPASQEEGKSIKKRYAVFHPDGRLAELKGFELKRRGELMLIKDFQEQVFRRFLDGTTLEESYASAAVIANAALDMLESKGAGYDPEEVLEKITESSNMARRLAEYPDSQKSLAITTAKRIAEFLGPQMVKDKGLACHFVISRLPAGRTVTERAIPLMIFRAEPAIRTHFLRKWTGDSSIGTNVDLQSVLDWEYYTKRFNSCVQKIITIPAALQSVPNPVPRVAHPDWLHRKIQQQNSRYRQVSLKGMFEKKQQHENEEAAAAAAEVVVELQDMEDLMGGKKGGHAGPTQRQKRHAAANADSDWEEEGDDDDGAASVQSDPAAAQREREAEERREAAIVDLRATYFSAKSTRALDSGFFDGGEGTAGWLARQRETWVQRARLRREMAAAGGLTPSDALGADGTNSNGHAVGLAGHFVDLKSRALSSPWQILEVREGPAEEPGVVQVLAALGRTLHTLRVEVPRTVIVDVDPDAVPPAPGAAHGGAEDVLVPLSDRVLPRHVAPGRLLQYTVPPGTEGERWLNALRINEGVRQVYEAHVGRAERLVERVGCCGVVRAEQHLRRAKTLPAAQRDVFALDELEATSAAVYLPNLDGRVAFVFHAGAETRGVWAVVHGGAATVVVVQPAGAPRPAVAWPQVVAEAARKIGRPAETLDVHLEVASDATAAWRALSRVLEEAVEGGAATPPLVVVVQSVLPTARLLARRLLPPSLPYLRVLGAAEDERLLSDPFRWARLLSQRLMERYFAAALWVEDRLAHSRIAGIPLCNVAQDSAVHALDVLYARELHRRAHVLWDSAAPEVAFDTVEERPRQVAMAGGYATWCVEFSLSRLEMVSILFSQMIQEGDDPSAAALCDRGVATHFNILRDLIADLLSQAVKSSAADALLHNVARWLRDPVARSYEPRLVELLSNLAHRALTSVLMRLAKLGGRTVRVDATSVTVQTPRHRLHDAMGFASFVTTSLQDQPMLVLLSLQPVRYWCPLLVLDQRDLAGIYVDAARAVALPEGAEPPPDALQQRLRLSFCGRLPRELQRRLEARVADTLQRLGVVAALVREELQRDPKATLATRAEEMAARQLRHTREAMEGPVQAAVIEEVHRIADARDLYTAAEREAAEAAGQTLWSSGALALEYAKCLTRVLELIPCGGAVGKMRNNCMRLCGVSPFAPQAQLAADPLSVWRVLPVTCAFCNTEVQLDLARRRSGPEAPFECPGCRAPIAAPSVEARLVRRVNQMVVNHNQQDFVCSKCKQVADTYLSEDCCGPLIGKAPPIHSSLQALLTLAGVQGFPLLGESITAALMCT